MPHLLPVSVTHQPAEHLSRVPDHRRVVCRKRSVELLERRIRAGWTHRHGWDRRCRLDQSGMRTGKRDGARLLGPKQHSPTSLSPIRPCLLYRQHSLFCTSTTTTSAAHQIPIVCEKRLPAHTLARVSRKSLQSAVVIAQSLAGERI